MLNKDIIKIIQQGINEQSVLLKKLDEMGYRTTQSTISRKLKQMNVRKVNGEYKIIEPNKENIKSIQFIAPNLFVIKTAPGHAGAIASIIDSYVSVGELCEIAGTIAGDDTIFIAIGACKNFALLESKLKKIIN